MEKNTVLAFILIPLILLGGTFVIQRVNEKNAPPPSTTQTTGSQPEALEPLSSSTEESDGETTVEVVAETPASSILPEQNFPIETIVEETDLFRITFSTQGGVVKDIELLQEVDGDNPISMVLDGDSEVGTFNMAFGSHETPYIVDVFDYNLTYQGKERIHSFSRNYARDGQVFTLSKNYRIIPGEYLIELLVTLETPDGKAVPLLDGNQAAYTLTYGPQIGPTFEKIDGRYEIRDNVTWGPDSKNGKMQRDVHKIKNQFVQMGETVNWAGVVGKYFAVIVDPGSGNAVITWDGRPADGQDQATRIQISRPARRQSIIEDTYRFYIGPLDRGSLARYDDATKNAFGIAGMGLQNAPRTSALLGWLENILRWLLEKFYLLIPNFGIAIILLTILVKAAIFPITHKSYESTSKMQAIQPKIKELQERYKDDKQKMNQKMGELYKEEGVNPLGGCLPMLLQLPVFFALYGVLNRYFPLRGATFIPGWIIDLSAPEFIGKEFAQPINLLMINIPAIRLLPIIYLAGQLLMSKVTQQGSASAQTGMQQKMLTLGLPIMFFFILYNMPSGLLLYWTTMNIITIIQQLITNTVKRRKAARGKT